MFFFLQAEVETRKRAVEGTLGGKTFKSFQDLKKYKADHFSQRAFVEEICRGIAVNTKYSSNIQVHCTSLYCKQAFSSHCLNYQFRLKFINIRATFFFNHSRFDFPGYLLNLVFSEARVSLFFVSSLVTLPLLFVCCAH